MDVDGPPLASTLRLFQSTLRYHRRKRYSPPNFIRKRGLDAGMFYASRDAMLTRTLEEEACDNKRQRL